ncbi:hypothetical protein [Phyllobacterium zundukense]|uniref:Uncharacterized protein n=1 Tax=Phyllobacterium zundukense TaxID=1867719 RepID=A0ACD4D533_9HYPH|nr:hypothetical protein [Phyllobacterium zundukense]UXN60902.1 hypothetical protein N8E88_31360 [Phyllobacterium zundukense]
MTDEYGIKVFSHTEAPRVFALVGDVTKYILDHETEIIADPKRMISEIAATFPQADITLISWAFDEAGGKSKRIAKWVRKQREQ